MVLRIKKRKLSPATKALIVKHFLKQQFFTRICLGGALNHSGELFKKDAVSVIGRTVLRVKIEYTVSKMSRFVRTGLQTSEW